MSEDTSMKRLEQAKEKHISWLREQPGFKGIGIGVGRSGNLCLRVHITQMPAAVRRKIEDCLGDVEFEFDDMGDVSAF